MPWILRHTEAKSEERPEPFPTVKSAERYRKAYYEEFQTGSAGNADYVNHNTGTA